MTDNLRSDALDWALAHVTTFGDSDFLPPVFEFDAIRHAWTWVRPLLEKVDFATHKPTAPLRLLAPKPLNGFRVIHRLDPLDVLLYTAATYEVAGLVEKARLPRNRGIACSYRIDPTPAGSFFQDTDGWPVFHTNSKLHAASPTCTHVVVADISDFYNQTYVHRVQNVLEDAGVAEHRANNIEQFLLNLNARQSQGIPVGPAASIVLAESLMNDVDTHILRGGFVHARYVDDFRIFCSSARQAVEALHCLSDYLNTEYRLSLQPGKTRVMSVAAFSSEHILDPDEHQGEAVADRVRTLVAQIRAATGYEISEAEVPPSVKSSVARDTAKALLEEWIASDSTLASVPRYLLRNATRLNTRALYGAILSKLDRLSCVFRDVVTHLHRTVDAATLPDVSKALLDFCDGGQYGSCPYVRSWVLWFFVVHVPDSAMQARVRKLAEEARPQLGSRPIAELARAFGDRDWVRSQKETWTNNAPWDRRAAIAAASVLATGERKHWLAHVERSGDTLDKAVAQFARQDTSRR